MNEPDLRAAGIAGVTFGKDVTVVQPVNLYGCTIGDNSFVGPFVEIQKGVRIGQRCRIQSHAFICELVVIGDDCFVSHGAMFINDLFDTGGPAGGDRNLWKETKIGNHVSIGTNATILPGHDLRSRRRRRRCGRDEGYHRAGNLCRQPGAPAAQA